MKAEPRFRKRMPCRLTRGPSTYSGVVLDLSRRGLFVQTTAPAARGDELGVQFSSAGQAAPIALTAHVVWERILPAQLRRVAEGGFGLQIVSAPESYYELLAGAARVSTPGGPGPQRSLASRRFRLRVKQEGGPRSRMIEVEAESEDQARTRGLAELGGGWTVIEIARR